MTGRSEKRRLRPVRLLPLALLAVGLAVFFLLDLDRFLGLEAVRRNHELIANWVSERPVLAAACFVLFYCAVVAFSLPLGSVLTVIGGYLFGPWLGSALVVAGATAGAVLVFLAARTALSGTLRARAGPRLQALRDGFARDALSYMLFLRLVPLFPFWLVNLAPALLGVRLGTFVLGTMVGIVPGTLVFAWVGRGLSSVLEGETLDLRAVLTPEILVALGLLGLLALLPVLLRRRRAGGEDGR